MVLSPLSDTAKIVVQKGGTGDLPDWSLSGQGAASMLLCRAAEVRFDRFFGSLPG